MQCEILHITLKLTPELTDMLLRVFELFKNQIENALRPFMQSPIPKPLPSKSTTIQYISPTIPQISIPTPQIPSSPPPPQSHSPPLVPQAQPPFPTSYL